MDIDTLHATSVSYTYNACEIRVLLLLLHRRCGNQCNMRVLLQHIPIRDCIAKHLKHWYKCITTRVNDVITHKVMSFVNRWTIVICTEYAISRLHVTVLERDPQDYALFTMMITPRSLSYIKSRKNGNIELAEINMPITDFEIRLLSNVAEKRAMDGCAATLDKSVFIDLVLWPILNAWTQDVIKCDQCRICSMEFTWLFLKRVPKHIYTH